MDKKTAQSLKEDDKGYFAEVRSKKILTKKGYSVEKIKSNAACNDFILSKDGKNKILEVKAAVDYDYPDTFFCETSSCSKSGQELTESFWMSQDLDLFIYYSFLDKRIYIYDAKKFLETAQKMVKKKNVWFIKKGTAVGFTFEKKGKGMGYLGFMDEPEDIDDILI
jgi:hypothetical protein